MQTNIQLQHDVQVALQNEANFKVREIGVIASDGQITLSGIQPSYARIKLAEATTKRVSGVDEIINHLYLNVTTIDGIEKHNVEAELANKLEGGINGINVSIDAKEVTLSGFVNSRYKKNEASKIALKTPGIQNVNNNLEVK